jgi:hypothetical protein
MPRKARPEARNCPWRHSGIIISDYGDNDNDDDDDECLFITF